MRAAWAGLSAAVWSTAASAGAVEREQHLGADIGGSILVLSSKTELGGSVGAHFAYGLTDAFNLMAEAAWSPVALGKMPQSAGLGTSPGSITNVDIGVAYVLDVGQWVPYGGALVGGYALTGGAISGASLLPGFVGALGLDYRFDRSWAAGVAFREHFLLTELSTYPSFTQVFARFEYTWGW
ncbi:MAG: hypothetical protein WBY94_29085 [Polyangiaceae bacterium]